MLGKEYQTCCVIRGCIGRIQQTIWYSLLRSLPITIRGTSHILPGQPVHSSVLDDRIGQSCGYLERKSGVRTRHYAGEASQIDMAVAASKGALQDAGMAAAEIDLVISASGIPFQTLPSTAPLIMRELGIADGDAAAFDVNSTCTSFLTALETAAYRIAAGSCKTALIVSSEIASRGLPWDDQPEVAALFGDGAAAALVSAADQPDTGIQGLLMRSYPSKYEACQIQAGGTRLDFRKQPKEFARHTVFQMQGLDLFKVTLKHFPDFIDALLQRAGWSKEDVSVVVPHQASPHSLSHMAQHSGFDPDVIVDLASDIGNQIAASLPTALDYARREGRIGCGARVLMLGTSAGVSFSGLALQM